MGRRAHYADFYGAEAADDRPALVVVGNCQAEALRLLLADPNAPYRTVRMPPVHEIEAADLPHLRALLATAHYVLMQPVADNYRGLPIGSRQLAGLLPAGACVVPIPVLFYAGTLPWQALVRDPRDGANDPPVVPYHDLRTLAQAATGMPRRERLDGIVEEAEASVADLRAREQAHETVVMSDLLGAPYAGIMHTINHPGNELLLELARRSAERLGVDAAITEPQVTLLDSIISPVEQQVARALGIAPRGPQWMIAGSPVEAAAVVDAQLQWYARNEPVVSAGLDRHGARMRRLGLL